VDIIRNNRSPKEVAMLYASAFEGARIKVKGFRPKNELNGVDVISGGSRGVRVRWLLQGLALWVGFGCVTAAWAAAPLQSPWDSKPVKVSDAGFRCAKVEGLPHDIVASDFYSDAKHSVIDEKRKAAYDAAKDQYTSVTDEAERAADDFQKSGSAAAAACVMQVLETQAAANAMAGNMSSNQANYVQNWTLGGLAISYLKVRTAGPALGATPEQMNAVQTWMKTVGQQVEKWFDERRAKGTTDSQNNHYYWAGFAVMATGIVVNDQSLYDWGVGTYKDGVGRVASDGTLPLEMARGQRALHYHLFALAPLVTMAEMGEANGQDLYSYDHNKLHLLVSRTMAGLVDNHYFAAKAGTAQDTPENGKIKNDDVVWATPYVRRFPDSGIQQLLNKGGSRPYGYLGGMPPA
jgi:poly(beta-D-mannuronate) lyase